MVLKNEEKPEKNRKKVMGIKWSRNRELVEVNREMTWSGSEERVEKRDGGVNEERIFICGEEESDEAIRRLIEDWTSDDGEKLPALIQQNLKTNGA